MDDLVERLRDPERYVDAVDEAADRIEALEKDDTEIGHINKMNLYFDWSMEGVGFGQLLFTSEQGKIFCENECMSREAVRKILRAFAEYVADNAVLIDEATARQPKD